MVSEELRARPRRGSRPLTAAGRGEPRGSPAAPPAPRRLPGEFPPARSARSSPPRPRCPPGPRRPHPSPAAAPPAPSTIWRAGRDGGRRGTSWCGARRRSHAPHLHGHAHTATPSGAARCHLPVSPPVSPVGTGGIPVFRAAPCCRESVIAGSRLLRAGMLLEGVRAFHRAPSVWGFRVFFPNFPARFCGN